MARRFLVNLTRWQWGLFVPVGLLVLIGLAAIFSVAINHPDRTLITFYRQLLYLGLGLAAMVVAALVDYRALRSYSLIIYGAGVLLLLAVIVFGITVRGTTGWLPVGFGLALQPVEFVKICFVVFLARYFSDHVRELYRWRPIILSAAALLLLVGLVLRQPDLGSALVFIGIWVGMLILLNVRRSMLLTILAIGVLTAIVGWSVFLKPYQKNRIMTFLNPERDPLAEGYNIRQSIVAVGSGGLFGQGLGLGPQSQLNFLPEAQTDFIFAVIAEELGFLGAAGVLLTYGVLFLMLVGQARRARDDFSVFLILGFGLLFFIQMFVNIGMNLGLVPVVGLPVPFISAGGSSLIASLICIGIVQSVYRHQPTGSIGA